MGTMYSRLSKLWGEGSLLPSADKELKMSVVPKTIRQQRVLSLREEVAIESARSLELRPDSLPGEEAIKLAAKIRARSEDKDRVFVFAGVVDRDGVSESAWEVAQAMAQGSPGEVLVIDADLTSPTLHQICGVALSPGLSESVFVGDAKPATIQRAHGIAVLPSGSASEQASLFSSAEYRSMLDRLKRQYRWIFIAGPPVLQAAAASLVASCSEGVVLVVNAGKNRKRDLVAAKRELEMLRASILGVVLYES